MNNPIFDKFISGDASYHNFVCKVISGDTPINKGYFATKTSSIRIEYKKHDPFITKVPGSFFETEEDLDETQIRAAVAYMIKGT